MDIEIKIKLSPEQFDELKRDGKLDLIYSTGDGDIRIILIGE
jgi:hypothetical protein